MLDWLLRVVMLGVGGVAAIQAYAASLDFTVAIVVGAFVFGMTALGLNNADAFWRARSLRGKLVVPAASVNSALDLDTSEKGITIAPLFHNSSLHPIAVVIEELEFTLGDMKSREKRDAYPTKEFFVTPGMPSAFKSGIIPIAQQNDVILRGKLHMIFRYGRSGATRIYDQFDGDLTVRFDENGAMSAELVRRVSGGAE